MKLRFTPQAIQDLAVIGDYLREHNPAATERVRAAILDALQNLLVFPRAGRRQTVDGVRKLMTRKYRYLIYYTAGMAAEEIIILSIRHPSREREHSDT